MSGLVLWPPPWELNSPLRRVASILWVVAMIPVLAVAFVVVVPVALFTKLTGIGAKVKRTREDVCRTIEQFIDGTGGRWDWDDFTSAPDADPVLEKVRRRCAGICDEFPPELPGQWCSPTGLDELRRTAHELRGGT